MPKTPSPLIFGRAGQVGDALGKPFPESLRFGRDKIDFRKQTDILACLNHHQPKIVINAAAYTEVDRAESDREDALTINALSPGVIAHWCRDNGASLIHYSTDYVYTGWGTEPFIEQSSVDPMNYYGTTKLAGERAIQESGCHHIILRTSWVFSPVGKNFVKTMLRLGSEKKSLRIVTDQVGSPTYAPDLAVATATLIEHENFSSTTGVFNICNSGFTSWFDFATSIFAKQGDIRPELEPITSNEFKSAAIRPKNSRLATTKIRKVFGVEMRPWQLALNDCLRVLSNP